MVALVHTSPPSSFSLDPPVNFLKHAADISDNFHLSLCVTSQNGNSSVMIDGVGSQVGSSFDSSDRVNPVWRTNAQGPSENFVDTDILISCSGLLWNSSTHLVLRTYDGKT